MTRTKLEQLIVEQREQTQEDIACLLEGIDNQTLDNVSQVIVDRFNIVLASLAK